MKSFFRSSRNSAIATGLAVIVGLCLHTTALAQRLTESELKRIAKTASEVMIYRDTFGVPHVYGPTDASVVFGYNYARAEDEFQRMQLATLVGLGRTTEMLGTAGFMSDRAMRLFEMPRLARRFSCSGSRAP